MPSSFIQFVSRHEGKWKPLATRWHRLGHYWQHFIVAVLLGFAIETAIHAAHDFGPIKRVQNAVLDTSLRFYARTKKPDTPDHRLPVLIVTDDVSTQSPLWGNDKGMTLPQALQLASHAFDRGARHVFLDITFDAGLSDQSPDNRAALDAFLLRYADLPIDGPRHLYVARSARVDPCFPRNESLDSLRTAVWDAAPRLDLEKRPGLVIHPVLPHYRADADHVVRGWDLFGVLRSGSPSESTNHPGWNFLPSPQLAYLVTKHTPKDSLHDLPWLFQPDEAAGMNSRAAFAAEQVQHIPLLSEGKFSTQLCTHHPDTLGCPLSAAHASVGSPSGTSDLQQSLNQINALLRPLPAEHGCRSTASELLSTGHDALSLHQPHDLLFNRIVFSLPPWEQGTELEQRGYYLRTPLTLQDDPLDWSNRVVAIGAAHAGSGDWHHTPIGYVPGVLINLNAMQSLEQIGPIAGPPTWLSFLINGLIIIAVAAVFSAMSPMAAAILSAAVLIGSLALFHQYLLSRGIWIEFGAPLIGINLHRIIDGYLAHRRLEAQVDRHAMNLVQPVHQEPKAPHRRKKKG